MKSLLLLWIKVAEDLATRCCTSATRDCKTVSSRFEHEGLSFLTITLPAFGKGFEKSLDQGRVDPNFFLGFAQRRNGLPRFLGGFLDRVFDRESGLLLDAPCIDAILAIRQLSLLFSKVAFKCSDARERQAIQEYVLCEKDVREHDSTLSEADMADFRRISSLLFAKLFSRVDFDVYYGNMRPKHGPGSTADKLRGNSKYRQQFWTTRLEEIFPMGEYLLPSPSYFEELDAIDVLEPGAELPVKVISVPKTQKAPRIIAMEPTAMQYAQQAVLETILQNLERFPYLSMIIGFDDQTPNQRMARDGSFSRELATLDLSEASDRVSNQLVRSMLAPHPHLHKAVDASRSRKADVPGHGVIRLAKFASMGSALCFPFEALVFTTLIFLGIERELNRPLCQDDVKRLSDQVRVYGDDIIIPVDFVQSVVRVLSTFGSKVNAGKSFWTGSFRESCGKEYYDGHDVSIVKVRHAFPTHRSDATGVISIVSLRNQLYFAGHWGTVKWLDDKIRKLIRHFPTVLPTSPVLGRHSFLGFETQRTGELLHNPLVKGWKVSSVIPSDPLDDHYALLKFHLKRGDLPSPDVNHLERSGRPLAVSIKLGWTSAV